MVIKKRLPGVYFQAETQLLEDKLPRMDVAAFVGFATSGPLDIPVPIEDEVRFKEIFGEDLPLAWDEEAGKMHYAYLAQAVRSFFLNGGQRCWVVRVADSSAKSNQYLIPGIVRCLPKDGKRYIPALATARSEGSWSDNLNVGTTLLSTPLRFRSVDFQASNEGRGVQLKASSSETVEAGDLLRLDFREKTTVLFLAVDKVESIKKKSIDELDFSKPNLEIYGQVFCFSTKIGVTSPPEGASPPEGEMVKARLLMADAEPITLTERATWRLSKESEGVNLVYLSLSPEQAPPRIGTLLKLEFKDKSTMLLSVNQVRTATRDEQQELFLSPPEEVIVISGKESLWPLSESDGIEKVKEIIAQGFLLTVERLTFEMWVRDGEGRMFRLSNLGFLKPHSRFLGDLPADEKLFGALDKAEPLPEGTLPRQSSLWVHAADPRFPLAISGNEDDVYLPIGMEGILNQSAFSTALGEPKPDTALERNGLKKFGKALFLDLELGNQSAMTLEATAFHKRYILNNGKNGKLKKIHAILPLEEVTLLSVPDVVHLGWEMVSRSSKLLSAPILDAVSINDDENEHIVSWTAVEYAKKYLLQEAADAQFSQSVIAYQVEETTRRFTHGDRCPRTYYYRVRAEKDGEISPWSNTRCVTVPEPIFEDCGITTLNAPILDKTFREGGGYCLRWHLGEGNAEKYTLQEATDPAFDSGMNLYEGVQDFFEVLRPLNKIYYYRVRAERADKLGIWSETLTLQPSQQEAWRMKRTADYNPEELVEIHQAMLRLSLVRGDLFTLLTLPLHYRESEVLAHKRALALKLAGLEEKALSYGALYHPWTFLRTDEGIIQPVPPDGPVTGSIAARAITRGAWIAPANKNLQGILALVPTIGDEGWARLYHEQVNLIRSEPQGFLLLSADTLSTDVALRPINVRRLLILLRRIALREGMKLVFEPNNEAFRGLVQRTFETVLSDLYAGGAFAGVTSDRAYQVVTDSSVNTQSSLEQGRFIVELRVAPSQPMVFITVRLVQGGSSGLLITEV